MFSIVSLFIAKKKSLCFPNTLWISCKLNLLYRFWISIKHLLFAQIYCNHFVGFSKVWIIMQAADCVISVAWSNFPKINIKYLLQLISFLNPEFKCCSSFVLPWVARVTNKTLSLLFVILNVPAPFEFLMIQFPYQISWGFISLLVKGILRIPWNLLKYLNGTTISIFFV